MRAPKHIRDLQALGKSLQDLTDFRFRLSGARITCGWNDSLRIWILGKVPRTGPTFISCKVGVGALVAMMDDPDQVCRDFEQMEKQAA